jgi:hypothetical protein
LSLVFLEDVRLHRAAHVLQHPRHLLSGLRLVRLAPELGAERIQPLIDGGIEKHREDRGRGAVDRHGHRRPRVAEVEAAVEHLHVVEGSDGYAGVADLAVDVRTPGGIEAVQRDGVERGGEAFGLGVPR